MTSPGRPPAGAVLARAPLRVSLAGGGTDLPSYARRRGGLVVSLAINRYVAVTVFPRAFDGGVHASFEERESASDVDGLRNRFARAVLTRVRPRGGVQLASASDAPSGTGLGGSGAFTVALLHALRHAESPTPAALAEEAGDVERIDLDRPVGKHDHYMAAFGGLRVLRIAPDLTVQPDPLAAGPAVRRHLREGLLLFYTGLSRDAGQVLTAQDRMTRYGHEQTVTALDAIHALAGDMLDAVARDAAGDIGPLLDAHWSYKVRLSDGVSNGRIDALYKCAREAGSDGGKLLGAGGGGFLLLSCRPGTADDVRAALRAEGLRELTFGPDDGGSRSVSLDLGSPQENA